MSNELIIALISSALGFLTGGIPAYLTYRATTNRLDAEAEERSSHIDINLTDATQKIVDSAGDSLDMIRKIMEDKIDAVEKLAELALKEAKMVKVELEKAKEEITNLTKLICELYVGAMSLIEQLTAAGVTPDFSLPDVGKEIQELIDKNGWH